MTGPEHYTEAERLIWSTNRWDGDIPESQEDVDQLSFYILQRAQVHATLALAAAHGTQCGDMAVVEPIGDKWREVAS